MKPQIYICIHTKTIPPWEHEKITKLGSDEGTGTFNSLEIERGRINGMSENDIISIASLAFHKTILRCPTVCKSMPISIALGPHTMWSHTNQVVILIKYTKKLYSTMMKIIFFECDNGQRGSIAFQTSTTKISLWFPVIPVFGYICPMMDIFITVERKKRTDYVLENTMRLITSWNPWMDTELPRLQKTSWYWLLTFSEKKCLENQSFLFNHLFFLASGKVRYKQIPLKNEYGCVCPGRT